MRGWVAVLAVLGGLTLAGAILVVELTREDARDVERDVRSEAGIEIPEGDGPLYAWFTREFDLDLPAEQPVRRLAATDAEAAIEAMSSPEVLGIVLDEATVQEIPGELLWEWRAEGKVLVCLGLPWPAFEAYMSPLRHMPGRSPAEVMDSPSVQGWQERERLAGERYWSYVYFDRSEDGAGGGEGNRFGITASRVADQLHDWARVVGWRPSDAG